MGLQTKRQENGPYFSHAGYPKRWRSAALARLVIATDAICVSAAVLAAYNTRAHIGPPFLAELRHPLTIYLRALPVVVLTVLVTGRYMGLYRARLPSIESQVPAILSTTSIATLLLAGASFLSHFDYSRAMLLLFWFYTTSFQLGARAALAVVRQRNLLHEEPVRALIVGTGELAGLLAEKLARAPSPGYECAGLVGSDETQKGDVIGSLEDLPELVRKLRIEEVFVAAPGIETDALMEVIDSCRELPTHFFLVAGPLQVLMGAAALGDLSQLPVIEVPSAFAPSQAYLIAKRILDLVLSVGLLVLLSPFMLAIVLLIRQQTKGSALFVQERVGQWGQVFKMYKFRTMLSDVDPYAPAPVNSHDPRVTPIGRWLRRYSLDELPQLINVLKGEMSLVGPRPEMPFIVERYKSWQRRRLDAKPGMTGLWQIMGRKDLPLAENIEYDFYYLRHQSLLLDLEILLRTIPAVFSGRGAY
jgi:exopolysaccharide biosynthesis polyprenyl glycosylphosphotransferase